MTLRIDPTGDDRAEFLAILEWGLSPLIREDDRPLRGHDDVDAPAAPVRARGADAVFEPVGPRSRKVRCRECGADGYPNAPWQTVHRLGHEHECRCGRRFASLTAISRHRRWARETAPGSLCTAEPV